MTAPAPNELCRAAVADLKARGWCKISSKEYQQTRPYNRFDGNVATPDRIDSLLGEWLKANKHELEDEEAFRKLRSYVTRSLVTVSGNVFMPNAAPIFVHAESKNSYVNTYRKHKPKTRRTDDINLFLELLDRLFPDAEDYGYCVGWLAHMFQRPEERPSWHLLFADSDTGVGKGFLVEGILNPLLKHTSVVRSFTTVVGKFSTLLQKNVLVLLDDPGTARAGTATQLKSLLSEERAFVEGKGAEGGMVRTYTRFILASNQCNPVGHEDNERRWYPPKPMKHRKSLEKTQEFIERVAQWLASDPTALDRIYNWFMAYDISTFNPKHVKQSATLLEMIGASKDPLDEFYADFITERKIFKYSELVDAIQLEGYTRQRDVALVAALMAHGLKKVQFRIGGKRAWYYCREGTTQADAEAHFATAPAF
jgi:hypothetical protein